MARRAFASVKLQEIRKLAAQWGKSVARRALDDPCVDAGLDFSALEQLAAAAAAGLTEGTLATLLEHHAQALGAEVPCPDCGHPCPVGREDRTLTIQGGQTISLAEPLCHCPDCR